MCDSGGYAGFSDFCGPIELGYVDMSQAGKVETVVVNGWGYGGYGGYYTDVSNKGGDIKPHYDTDLGDAYNPFDAAESYLQDLTEIAAWGRQSHIDAQWRAVPGKMTPQDSASTLGGPAQHVWKDEYGGTWVDRNGDKIPDEHIVYSFGNNYADFGDGLGLRLMTPDMFEPPPPPEPNAPNPMYQ